MKRALALLMFVLAVLPLGASALPAVYTGSLVVPTGSTITVQGALTGCGLFNASGQLAAGACPSGTAVFTGGTNITVTGSNPYTINCPTCFTTAGGTISAPTIFSSTVTMNSTVTATQGLTNSSTTNPVISGASNTASAGYEIGAAVGFTQLLTSATAVCAGIPGSALMVKANGTAVLGLDTSGNLCVPGTMYYISDPKQKQDIRPAGIDALALVDGATWDLFWAYKHSPNQTHYGPMATDFPAYISGPHHDRIDLEAMQNTEGRAIQQLSDQVRLLWILVVALAAWCFLLAVGLALVARAKSY